VIRQKNGADTLYTLHTSKSSGDLLLTNEGGNFQDQTIMVFIPQLYHIIKYHAEAKLAQCLLPSV
jgi:hypothetical protein